MESNLAFIQSIFQQALCHISTHLFPHKWLCQLSYHHLTPAQCWTWSLFFIQNTALLAHFRLLEYFLVCLVLWHLSPRPASHYTILSLRRLAIAPLATPTSAQRRLVVWDPLWFCRSRSDNRSVAQAVLTFWTCWKFLRDCVLRQENTTMRNQQCSLKPASHWPIIKDSEGPQSVVRSDEICSDYFPPIVSIQLDNSPHLNGDLNYQIYCKIYIH